MIELIDVKKTYNGRTVLDIPELRLQEGVRYALIGPNGSGKSTLLRILAGVLKPDAGTVHLGIPPADIAYSPQSPYAFDHTVLRNVMLGITGEEDAKRKALTALEQVGLENLSSACGKKLSGGETQRMVLARMIAKPHKLLLLDEPTSSTDVAAEEQIEQALLEYARACGCSLIFSTHEPGQALRLAEQVLVLYDGRIVEAGETGPVLHAPQSEEGRMFLRRWIV